MSDRKLKGRRFMLRRSDPRYPKGLEEVDSPPEIIYGIGDPAVLEPGLAVIGARKATPYGIGCARKFAGIAASKGVVIVSGGAYGCDFAAHQAALEQGGRTVVVFGGGCDKVYPARHFDTFQKIIDRGGAVISENAWDVQPKPWMFLKRNRIIAGLSRATLIVEAGLKSGTFSTADNALNSNRDVLVIPGPINSENSHGSNLLIRQGATPIIDDESFDDALLWLFGILKTPQEPSADSVAKEYGDPVIDAVVAALRGGPMRADEVGEMLKQKRLPSSETTVLLALNTLEIEGAVARYLDGRYGVKV